MVSVLLLSWNHEKYIEQSINSVIDQTYYDLEIIFLDNNSTDNTFSIAQQILEKSGLPYQAYKREKQFSIAQNFNFLFEKSSGEFFCTLSGDDWLHPENIEEKLKPFAQSDKIGMTYSEGFYYYEDLDIYKPLKSQNVEKGNFLQELLQRNFVSAQGSVIKREVIKEVGLWDESLLLEDWDMWIRIAMRYEIFKVDQQLFYYRKHSTGISGNLEFMYEARNQIYYKYKEINDQQENSLKKNWEMYIENKARETSSFNLTWQILKKFTPNAFYVKLLIKSVIPSTLKKKYFTRALKKSE